MSLLSPVMTGLHRLRRLGWRVSRPVTIGVRIGAFNDAGDVLMVRHTYLSGWFFPGGAVDSDETLPAAAARELAEETGVRPEGVPRLVGMHSGFRYGKSDHVAIFAATVRGQPRAGGLEIVEARFFPRDGLPTDLSPSTRQQAALLLGWPPGEDRPGALLGLASP